MTKISSNSSPLLRWAAWTMLCTFSIFQFVIQNTVGIASSQIKYDLQADAALIGILSSSFYYSYIPMQIFAGILFDRFGLRTISFLSITASGLGCIWFALAQSSEALVLARIFTGAACSFAFVGMLLGTRHIFAAKHFALISALAETISMVVAAFLNTALAKISQDYGFRALYYACAAAFFLLAFGTLLTVKNRYPMQEGDSHEEHSSFSKVFSEFILLLRNRNIWIAGISGGFTFAIVSVFASLWAMPYIQELFKVNQVEATEIVQILYLGIGIASPPLGWLVAKIDCTKIIFWGTLLSIISCYYLVGDFSPNWSLFCIALFILGCACSVYHLSFVLISNSVERKVQGSAMGLTNLLLMLSAPILQLIVGIILSETEGAGILDGFEKYSASDYQKALIVLPIGLVISLFLVFAYKKQPTEN